MTLITRVSRLRLPGVLRDLTWPADLPDFGRYNLIYGWNGTGKTSLSRVLRAMEVRTVPVAGHAVIRIGTNDVRSDDFGSVTTSVRVFNKDFVNEAVFPSRGGDVPPIFVVGRESAEKQKEVDLLKGDRAKTETELSAVRSKKQEADRALDKFCVDRARIIKDTLRSSGSNPYNNYDKASFRNRAEQMVADGDAATHRLSDANRGKLLDQHAATPRPKLSPLTHRIPAPQQLTEDVSVLLSTTVVSRAIPTLKGDPELSMWAHEGLRLHHQRNADKCLFCEQRLPSGRLEALEAHFSAEYENFMQALDAKIDQLKATAKRAAEVKIPNKAELYGDLVGEYETAEQTLRAALEATRRFVDALVEELTNKKGQPFDRLTLDVPMPSVDGGVIDALNTVIGKHNQACDEFQSRVAAARSRLALDMISEVFDEFVRLKDAQKQAGDAVKKAEQEVRRLTDGIARLEREIVEHRQPAEELNEDLHKYLGHGELKLQIKDTGYFITRNGVPAEALSEGETTAIALLYFLKSLKDRRFDLKKGVVVLDDPVSSLDANALYLAFGFIRERTQNAGQLFIFTHNFTFFRQARNWFHHLRGQNKRDVSQRPARFYMLDWTRGEGQRSSAIMPLDPLLEQYESEYHYLFSRIYREAHAGSPAELEQNYFFPNMARRVLEAFLAFRQPHVAGELWQKVKNIDFDEAKKLRILRFVHTYSHGDTIGEPEHDPSLLGEAQSVLQDLLDFIKSQDAQHFLAMKELVKPHEEEEGDDA